MTLPEKLRLLAAAPLVLALASCDLIQNLPVITPGAGVVAPGNITSALNATITRNGARLPATLQAFCEIDLQITPQRFRALASIRAIQGPGTSFTCLVPPAVSTQVRANHNVRMRWQVFSPRQGQSPLKVAESPHVETQLGCGTPTRAAMLAGMQAAAFGALPLSTATPTAAGVPRWHPADIIANQYVPTHGATLFDGMGVAFIRKSAAGVGLSDTVSGMNFGAPNAAGPPDLLLFLPRPGATNVRDIAGFDGPYTLIGWAYAQTITGAKTPLPTSGAPAADDPEDAQQKRPAFTCIGHHEWMIHAKGVHNLNGSFDVAPTPSIGAAHNALWDLHVFIVPGGVPEVAITRSTGAAITGGVPFSSSAFFYPIAYD